MAGNVLATVFTAIIAFAVLPGLETFEAFSLAIALYLVPVGALMARWQTGMFLAMAFNFVPLLAPANQMSYVTLQFYNAALAIVAGRGPWRFRFACCRRCHPHFGPAVSWL